MPGKAGTQILEALRMEGWVTPVVLFSTFFSDDIRLRAARAGSSALPQKPFHLVDLSNAAGYARME